MNVHQARRRSTGVAIAALSLIVALSAPVAAATAGPVTPSNPTKTSGSAPLLAGSSAEVADHYIVVLAGAAGAQAALPAAAGPARSAAMARARSAGAQIDHQYAHAISGFSARLNAAQLRAVRADPAVAYVVPDGVVHARTAQTPATWGLDRIDQRALPLNTTYTYTSTGAGVSAYVIDTGIRLSHSEFGGRAVAGYTAITDGNATSDCNGHGTHVAGTVGGATYGVAKGVRLVSVRVLDCSGSGTWAGVIAGIDWVTANHAPSSVANVSLTGSANQAVDDAVARSIGAGVTYAVAAGNDGADACASSPARTPAAITVGATTMIGATVRTDSRDVTYSNFGPCLDLFAPGTAITSAWIGSDTATDTISGTSMAAPHVAGVAARYLQEHPGSTPAQVRDAIVYRATPGLVANAGLGSPNRLLLSDLSTLFLTNAATGRYLDSNLVGLLYTSTTLGGPSQQWSRSGSTFRDLATGLCLDSSPAGAAFTLTCSGAATQNWVRNADTSIRNVQTGLCLDGGPLGVVTALTCTGAPSQKWNYRP